MKPKSVTYRDSGVDIDRANRLVRKIRSLVDTTKVAGSMDSIGGFGGFFDLSASGGGRQLLVASTDGVGTKLKIAQAAAKHDTIGIDLVAMCVNDILCCGAKPLFFLDYFATGRLKDKVWEDIIKGIVKGCRMAGCALIGGETAEMPGMYGKGEYDLAGFAVGSVNKRDVVDGRSIRPGDVILGLASSGLHSNGYSLVRKVLSVKKIKENARMLLKPTVIYTEAFDALKGKVRIKGAAHITGGGFFDNIPRMLPRGVRVRVKKGSWRVPRVFKLVGDAGNMTEKEKYRTFNMGIGMALALSPVDADRARKVLDKDTGIKSRVIGMAVKGPAGVDLL